MKKSNRIALGILVMASAVFLVTACAAGIPDPGSMAGSPVTWTATASQSDSIHRLGSITWYHASVGGVVRHRLPAPYEITIGTNDVVVLKVPALVSGAAGTRGMVLIGDDDSDVVRYSRILTPGKWGTLKTVTPPLRWTEAGVHHLIVQVIAPDGGTSLIVITVTVE